MSFSAFIRVLSFVLLFSYPVCLLLISFVLGRIQNILIEEPQMKTLLSEQCDNLWYIFKRMFLYLLPFWNE